MLDLCDQLAVLARGRVCLMGLGNEDYGDDGLGVVLAREFARTFSASSEGGPDTAPSFAAGAAVTNAPVVIIAGTAPERCLSRFSDREFDHVVFFDAVEFGGEPGSAILLEGEAIAARFPQISTHKLSLGLLARWVESRGAKAWLLGVQPASLRPTRTISSSVQATLAILNGLLAEVWVPLQAPVGA